ncbi:mechanosensitive ion channel family protein [Martelella lutilitoris]|uniref:Mechanosensitive ion channel family protein n=1 Tax=Martelella lutilitoris TaxID=2583532 RepID=A0A7T7KK10_9HYPH|nr:mechanosensitive ion channel domain-containing protein [Martelella lutilitoris]QQM29088.1 mechanosensitive ion channel family protein [Martelella lutilitoris]
MTAITARLSAFAFAILALPRLSLAQDVSDAPDKLSPIERLGAVLSFFADNATAAAARLEVLMLGLDDFPAEVSGFLHGLSEDGFSLGAVILRVILCLGIGAAAEAVFRTIFRRLRAGFDPKSLAQRIIHVAVDLAGLLIFAMVGGWPLLMSVQADPGAQLFVVTYLTAFFAIRGFALLARIPLSPGRADLRIVALSDPAAGKLYWQSVGIFALAIFFLATTSLLRQAGMPADETLTLSLFSRSVVTLLLIIACLTNRFSVAAILATDPAGRSRGPGWKSLSAVWHLFAIFYICLSWFGTSLLLLLNRPQAGTLSVLSFMIILALVIGCLLMDDWAARADARDRARRRAALEAEPQMALPDDVPTFAQFFARLGQAAAVLVALLALIRLWSGPWQGLSNPRITAIMPSLTQLLVTLALAYVGWHLVLIGSQRMLLKAAYAEGTDEAEKALRQSRVATVLPLVRNTLLITIASIAAIIAISALGIDVLPLLAGAGIVGIAIGMGSQTLVKDVISGIFFLVDDAFRVGDLVDVGVASGTVERAGIRSVQIRHPLGAIHTVPFGEIRTIANKSRDWAAMWLEFRLPLETDLDGLEPRFRALNDAFLADPVHGRNLVAPLENAGIVMIDDSAMVLRIVYKCRPGTQFALRAVVYDAVRRMFREAGISIAPREVRLRAEPDFSYTRQRDVPSSLTKGDGDEGA